MTEFVRVLDFDVCSSASEIDTWYAFPAAKADRKVPALRAYVDMSVDVLPFDVFLSFSFLFFFCVLARFETAVKIDWV